MTDHPSTQAAPEPGRRRYRFTILLASLFLLLVSAPFLRYLGTEERSLLRSLFFTGLFAALLISAVNAVSESRRTLVTARALAGLTIVLEFLEVTRQNDVTSVASSIAGLAFIGFVIAKIMAMVFQAKRAKMDTIAASLCAYLLMGIFWAIAFSLTWHLDETSFHLSTGKSLTFGGEGSMTSLYFSFVTLTTLGYGDVTPHSDPARMLAIAEAVIGQVFMVVLVARLVGLNVAEGAARSE